MRVAVRRPDLAFFPADRSAASARSRRSRRTCAIRPLSPPRSKAPKWPSTPPASRLRAGLRPIAPSMSTEPPRSPARPGPRASIPTSHVSGIGADPNSPSPYIASKGRGEKATLDGVPRRDDPSTLGRVRTGGRLLQPLRRARSLLLGHSAVRRRRDASAAGICRRRRARRGRGAGRRSQAGRRLRTRRTAGDDAARSRRVRPACGRTSPPSRRVAACAVALASRSPATLASKASLGLFPKLLDGHRDEVDLLAADNVVSAEGRGGGTRSRAGSASRRKRRTRSSPSYLVRFRKTGQYELQRSS